ncbi:hypothetical protein [Wolbachia pipientis]|uniref:hypothetical protein n=1 Tax=Wolbachia pipientis TaxID=955 RepID=UPI0025A48DEC|nr:hypothetical protein [Wolbachia pipientis]MDM8334854.1 hypothetical protein [Wolbachia pipientis]
MQDISKSVYELCTDINLDVKKKLGEVNVKKIMYLVNVIKDRVKSYQPSWPISKFGPGKKSDQDEKGSNGVVEESNGNAGSQQTQSEQSMKKSFLVRERIGVKKHK